jgi:hypothetical protein
MRADWPLTENGWLKEIVMLKGSRMGGFLASRPTVPPPQNTRDPSENSKEGGGEDPDGDQVSSNNDTSDEEYQESRSKGKAKGKGKGRK